ncbi:MAG: hypothetical protein K6E33_07320 [Lachnospiraceae bacterium]|nr:hypothetical protein [Lachnospiraceae bacterium]
MAANTESFKSAIRGAHIPLLTLDMKWYCLFRNDGMPDQIKKKSEELNALLRKQGRNNTELKKLKLLKKKLLDEMVPLLETGKKKELAEHKKLVDNINERLSDYENNVTDIPEDIEKVNRELMMMTMETCYERLQFNQKELNGLNDWLKTARVELKKNVARKQEREILNRCYYTYMYQMFGPDVMDIFDMEYEPQDIRPKEEMTE